VPPGVLSLSLGFFVYSDFPIPTRNLESLCVIHSGYAEHIEHMDRQTK
jgi:hypothetical protein